jgi:hypothetical protein
VDVVQGRKEIGSIARLHWPLRNLRDRFLTSRVRREPGDNRRVVSVFHFSAVPSVTAGFIGFVFDIRIVIKVAGLIGRDVLKGHGFSVAEYEIMSGLQPPR